MYYLLHNGNRGDAELFCDRFTRTSGKRPQSPRGRVQGHAPLEHFEIKGGFWCIFLHFKAQFGIFYTAVLCNTRPESEKQNQGGNVNKACIIMQIDAFKIDTYKVNATLSGLLCNTARDT